LISPFPDERPVASEITEQIGSTGAEVTAAAKGVTGSLGEFTWEIVSSLGIAGSSANEASLGMKFESKDLIIYTLADLNEVAQDIMQSEIFDSSKPTFVKVSHHGSADQSAELYRRIGADAALISVGKKNSYGHPTSRVLKILGDAKTQVFRTDLSGSIAMGVSNGVIEVKSAGAR
jgi:competence protein ComEC